MTRKLQIPAELAEQMSPEVRAFVDSLILRIETL